VVLLGCFQTQHQHVEDNPDVEYENQESQHVRPAQQIGYFEGDINGTRRDGQPLRPGANIPQSVSLDEAKDYVDGGHSGYLPQAHVADPVDEVDEDACKVVVGVGVKKFEEALGDSPNIFVAHGENAQAGEQDDDSLGKFEGGDGAHTFDVSGVADFWMWDSGVHLITGMERLVADSF
jgi:hypothetical protein